MAAFSKEFNTFFKQLKRNNNKEWFHENKKRYEEFVKNPFTDFTGEIISLASKLDPEIKITPRESLFRINKDIRFSKDKSPYKTHMAAVVSPSGRKNLQDPGLYFEMGINGVMIAGGLHSLDKGNLMKVRKAIQKNPAEFRKLLQDKTLKKYFGLMQGEKNKVVPKEFKADLEKIPELANKQFFYWVRYEDTDVILRKDIAKFIMGHYKAIRKFNKFMKKALK